MKFTLALYLTFISILALVSLAKLAQISHIQPNFLYSYIKEPLKQFHISDIPTDFNWGDVYGVNFLTLMRQENVPRYCGSSWAFAATTVLSDRIKITRNAQWPDINISPQYLLSCDYQGDDYGCEGGDDGLAYKFMHENNITDETCSIYQAKGWTDGLECTNFLRCGTCSTKSCGPVTQYFVYQVDEYGPVSGEDAMVNEIYQRGPISCSIAVTQEFENYTGGIFYDQTGDVYQTHVILVYGFGVENGEKFWYGQNSWGQGWGEKGFFRIVRGVNNLGIESDCNWATPKDTWSNQEKYTERVQEVLRKSLKQALPNIRTCTVLNNNIEPNIVSPQPYEYLKESDVPTAWDWRNISGKNYLTWNVNQHLPVYCGSCWAQGSSSAMADRISILRNNSFPQIALSVQMILNCKAGGGCDGGDPLELYAFAHKHGIAEQSCQNYEAKVPEKPECTDIQQCMNCDSNSCWAVKNFTLWKAKEYGYVATASRMKAEIYARGPIACTIPATEKFENYSGGIFSELEIIPLYDHVISLIGWGVENNEEYWIGRNSWGTFWGEHGFFRIRMYKDNLGIENLCFFAVPEV